MSTPNHIHADDLAQACVAALWRAAPQRIYHVSDDTHMKMGDYLDAVAAKSGLPSLPRMSQGTGGHGVFSDGAVVYGESRRLENRRLKHELRVRLRYPTVLDSL